MAELSAEHKRRMREGRARAEAERRERGIASWHAYREWLREDRALYARLQAAREQGDPAAVESAREAYSMHLATLRVPFGPPPRR